MLKVLIISTVIVVSIFFAGVLWKETKRKIQKTPEEEKPDHIHWRDPFFLNKNSLNDHMAELKQAFFIEKIYLTPGITLDSLSNQLQIPKNSLLLIIDDQFGVKFNDLIDNLRIDEAKAMIRKDETYSLQDIAREVGFGSLSSFDHSFRRFTGMSPAKFHVESLSHNNEKNYVVGDMELYQ